MCNKINRMDDITDDEWGKIQDESEYAEEWLNRDAELEDMSLEEYDEMRCVEDYGLTDEEIDDED